MDPFSSALAAWIAFHARLGVDLEALLLPGASEAEIVAVEDALGHRLPDDLRALYRYADGQIDPWGLPIGSPPGYDGERFGAMFGHFVFLPLERALEQHRGRLETYADFEPEDFAEPWGLRPDDPIDPIDWQETWFGFAGDTNGYAVDLAPPRGGSVGQIVQIGPDSERRLVASSLTELLERAAANLDPEQPGRLDLDDDSGYDDPVHPSVQFEMDWTWTPPIPPSAEEIARMAAESEARHRLVTAEREAFLRWMIERGTDDALADATLATLQSSALHPGLFGPALFEHGLPETSSTATLLDELDVALYLRMFGGEWLTGERADPPLDEAFAHYALWRLQSGAWSTAEFEAARRVLEKPRELPPGVELRDTGGMGFFSLERNPDGSVTINHSGLSRPITLD